MPLNDEAEACVLLHQASHCFEKRERFAQNRRTIDAKMNRESNGVGTWLNRLWRRIRFMRRGGCIAKNNRARLGFDLAGRRAATP